MARDYLTIRLHTRRKTDAKCNAKARMRKDLSPYVIILAIIDVGVYGKEAAVGESHRLFAASIHPQIESNSILRTGQS